MRNEFYGDSRDVAKWSTILKTAKTHHCKSILYVGLLRCDEHTGEGLAEHHVDGEAPIIWRFFEEERSRFRKDVSLRKATNVKNLERRLGIKIEVVDRLWEQSKRDDYFKPLRLKGKLLVFLDPDTGIASEKRRSFGKKDGTKWIKASEVAEVFNDRTGVLGVALLKKAQPHLSSGHHLSETGGGPHCLDQEQPVLRCYLPQEKRSRSRALLGRRPKGASSRGVWGETENLWNAC